MIQTIALGHRIRRALCLHVTEGFQAARDLPDRTPQQSFGNSRSRFALVSSPARVRPCNDFLTACAFRRITYSFLTRTMCTHETNEESKSNAKAEPKRPPLPFVATPVMTKIAGGIAYTAEATTHLRWRAVAPKYRNAAQLRNPNNKVINVIDKSAIFQRVSSDENPGQTSKASGSCMMPDLKPWMRGPFELIQHAEGHRNAGGDFDKRMALISYDNAVEVSISTHLQLHPGQRGNKFYERKDIDRWQTNFHTKLDFLDEYLRESGVSPPVTRDVILWYHNLRNDIYHYGNGMVPEQYAVDGAREAAMFVFFALFGVELDRESATGPGFPLCPIAFSRYQQPFVSLRQCIPVYTSGPTCLSQ
jgi:hypothetical protein